MGLGPIERLRALLDVEKGGNNSKGAFVANNDKKDFDEEFRAAYNGATGYVSPPSSNIMGFGPKSENA